MTFSPIDLHLYFDWMDALWQFNIQLSFFIRPVSCKWNILPHVCSFSPIIRKEFLLLFVSLDYFWEAEMRKGCYCCAGLISTKITARLEQCVENLSRNKRDCPSFRFNGCGKCWILFRNLFVWQIFQAIYSNTIFLIRNRTSEAQLRMSVFRWNQHKCIQFSLTETLCVKMTNRIFFLAIFICTEILCNEHNTMSQILTHFPCIIL